MDRTRVAAVQYFLRPVREYQGFVEQVEGFVELAAGYRSDVVVFPEYFTLQLLTLETERRPVVEQIRHLARQKDRFVETMATLAKKHEIHIVAGTTPVLTGDALTNESFFFSPSGRHEVQGKMLMTRWEAEEWNVQPHDQLKVFETAFGKVAILICYDVEFPELARAAALEGASLIIVPSCTDDRSGFLRVRYCAQARCIENQVYAVHTGTVGSIPRNPAISLNYGQASILTPCDYAFARDGILREGIENQETMLVADLDLALITASRESGSVLPLRDSARSKAIAAKCTVVPLPD